MLSSGLQAALLSKQQTLQAMVKDMHCAHWQCCQVCNAVKSYVAMFDGLNAVGSNCGQLAAHMHSHQDWGWLSEVLDGI